MTRRLLRGVACAVLAAVVCSFGTDLPAAAPAARLRVQHGLVGVLIEPSRLGSAAGMRPVYAFVLSAKKRVDMTMYELIDPTMVKDLIADRKRGVVVRVILDTNRERSRNLPAFRALKAGGVSVVWADTAYEATHQKTITVDDDESLIASFNLTAEYYTTTRDFGIWDTNRADVSAIEAVFDADFAHRPVNPSNGTDLVWSPGSQSQMLAVINGARHSLSIENEEMDDPAITRAIVAAARRGVNVEITMTADSSYDGALDVDRQGRRPRPPLRERIVRPLHPRQGDDRRRRLGQPTHVRRQHQLLERLDELQPRARDRHVGRGRHQSCEGRRGRGLRPLFAGNRLQELPLKGTSIPVRP